MSFSDKNVILYIVTALSKKVFLTLICIAFLLALLDLLGILLIYPYISMVLDSKYTNKFQYVNDLLPPMHHGDFVLALSLSLAAFYMVKVAIHGQLLKKQNQIVANFTRDMTDNFLHKVLNAKFEIFNALSASRLAGVAFSNTVHASLVLQAVIQIVCELMFLFFLFSIFLASAPKFGIGIVVITAVYILVIYKPLGRKIANLGVLQNEIENSRHRILHSIVASMRDIKIMGLSSVFSKKNTDISEKFADVNWKYSTYQGMTRVYLETIMFLALVAFIQILIFGKYPLKDIAPFIGVVIVSALRALPAIAKLLMSVNSYRYSKSFVERLIDMESILSQSQQEKIVDNLNYEKVMDIKNLSFTYGHGIVLNQVNINIKKGHSVGIVGPSGSGKSTLLDIITGLLKSQTGSFYLDDVKFDPFFSSSLHDILGYVPQSISLLDESIAYNITFEHEPDYKRLNKVLRMSNLETFVNSLQYQENTIIGEGGIALSGGQRQRVGIARALYKEPKILIFDEATSALDSLSEKAFIDEISALRGYVTTVVVAHKLSTVVNCDTIYVLHKGQIVASANHNELMVSCPLYQEMFKLQQVLM